MKGADIAVSSVSEFYKRLQAGLAQAQNEAEVRQRFSEELYSTFGVQLRIERGRSDGRRNRVILEFKDKGLFRGSLRSAKFKEAYQQLTKKYIPKQSSLDGVPKHDYIGVAIDGDHYAFVFFEQNGTHRSTELFRLTEQSIRPLIDAIVTDSRRLFTTENLLEDFGASSEASKETLKNLWLHLQTCLDVQNSQKTQMLFQEWKRLFAQASNFGNLGRRRLDDYLLSLGMSRPLDYTRALFILHTYNALLFKLIAAELLSAYRHPKYSGFSVLAAGSPDSDIVALLDARIEHSEIFRAHGIENFIEGTFFSWYLEAPPQRLLEILRSLLRKLALYRFPDRAQEDVSGVVKAIYQNLVPDALRKNIGEFYTPEWLAEFVLDEAGYKGKGVLNKKLLDPCCGSGTFLVHAIGRLKYQAKTGGLSDSETLDLILEKVFGIDLNPLAVIASRLSYLLSIIDLLAQGKKIEIPVYLADAVYAPTLEFVNGSEYRTYRIGTVLDTIELSLPEELVSARAEFGLLLSQMEVDVELQADIDTFFHHLSRNAELTKLLKSHPEWRNSIQEMFERIREMEKRKWNRVWCRIIRNYFASIAIGKVDVIAGNPPWIRWSALPEDYRELIKPTCERYDIFSRTPFFGGNELDVSGIISYTVADRWLMDGGVQSFVITQIHFQAPSSEGFRSFRLPDGTDLGVRRVHDFTEVRPFRELANKPAVFMWKRGEKTKFPVEYVFWKRRKKETIPEGTSYKRAMNLLKAEKMRAYQLDTDKRWSILSKHQASLFQRLSGGSQDWTGRKGILTDLNGAYFVKLLGPGTDPGTVKISTQPSWGRKPVPILDHDIESELIYPLLKGGAELAPFEYTPIDEVAIVPNRRITSIESETVFRRAFPAAYRYFRRINSVALPDGTPLLEGRSTWKSRMRSSGTPFYAIYNVGGYSFRNFKVAWAEIAQSFAAAVVSDRTLPNGIGIKPIIPDHKIYYISTDDENAAHFLCALMNSEPVRVFIDSFTVKLQVGTLFKHLSLPAFDESSKLHLDLAKASKMAHRKGPTPSLLSEIDKLAWQVI